MTFVQLSSSPSTKTKPTPPTPQQRQQLNSSQTNRNKNNNNYSTTMAVYRSEVHIPVQKDSLSFQDRQIKQWSNAEERRKQWQDEFERMRQEFFVLKPSEKQASGGPTTTHFINMDTLKTAFDTDSEGRQVFRVRSVLLAVCVGWGWGGGRRVCVCVCVCVCL